jgi:hypothetical protein
MPPDNKITIVKLVDHPWGEWAACLDVRDQRYLLAHHGPGTFPCWVDFWFKNAEALGLPFDHSEADEKLKEEADAVADFFLK